MSEAPPGIRAAMSVDDYRRVERLMNERGWQSLSMPERWRWHAYMRAWREAHHLGVDQIDPTGKWHDPRLDEPASIIVREARRP